MKRLITTILLTLLLLRTPGAAEDAGIAGVAVGTFPQEQATHFRRESGLPDGTILDIAVTTRGSVFCGTGSGLRRLAKGRWSPVPGFTDRPAPFLAPRGDDGLVLVYGDALWLVEPTQSSRLVSLPGPPPRCLDALPSTVALGTDSGLFLLVEGSLVRDDELLRQLGESQTIRDLALAPDGDIAIAADAGLFLRTDGKWHTLSPHTAKRSWSIRDARAVAFDHAGRPWIACAQGVGVRAAEGWRLFTGLEGLPVDDFTCIATGTGDTVWFGTRRGAVGFDGKSWSYRQGRRWLPHDELTSLTVSSGGDLWAGTADGVARIARRPMTLEAKALFFDDEIDRRHRRTPHGFVLSAALDRPGDRGSWKNHDSDNDGLWTAMYGAGECFAYAVTRSPVAKERARRAFEALKFLGDVTRGGSHPAPPGFIARTVLPTDGPDPNAGRLERDRRTRATRDRRWKIIDPRWPVSADGKWYWKCDTSSDELDGHYFLYAQYHDLVAETDEEKRRVRDVVVRLTDHIIAHDFNLVDHDGQPTRWGHFGPADLNHDPAWWEERGLNSLSVLSYLKVAEHVSGDRKYADAARTLIDKHGYAANVLCPKNQTGPGTGNQSDDEMAFMGFYNLLRYERDPSLRRIYAYAFHHYWTLERPEMNPLFHFLYAAVCSGETWSDPWGKKDLSPTGDWLDDSVETLRRFPLDLADWRHTNSHRLDVVPISPTAPSKRPLVRGLRRNGKVIPIDERYVEHWNHDPFRLDSGGGGRTLADGASFLLPYWLGRHHGFLR